MNNETASHSVDLTSVTIETFEPYVGSTFVMSVPDCPDVELLLIKTIDELLEANAQLEFRHPFSLVFEAADETVYPQRIRQLRHPVLGSLEVFLIPFGIFEGKVRYNVIFC